jgi:hypothetical protein
MSSRWSSGCGIIGASEHADASRPPRPLGLLRAREEESLPFLIRISKSHSPSSSPGLTGRSSIPEGRYLSREAAAYWMPHLKRGHDEWRDTRLHSRDTIRPSCSSTGPSKNRGRRECRVHAAPAASRANEKAHEQTTTGTPKQSGTPCAMVYGLFRALVTGLSCHRRFADNPAKLDTSVGVSGPHDFAVRHSFIRRLKPPRPSHPAPRFVTIAKRPPCERGTAEQGPDLPDGATTPATK